MADVLPYEQTEEERALQVADARAYLSKRIGDNDLDPTISDTNGLVTYINATTNPPPEELVKEREEISAVLEGLTGIIVSAVLETAGNDKEAKHKPELWEAPLRNGLHPFTGAVSSEVQVLNREVVGVEIATEFLTLLMDAVTEQGQALDGFKKFLEKQGRTIGIKGEKTEEGYRYACIGMVHEIFQVDGHWQYVPKIRLYFTSFTRETFKVSSACASFEKIKFNFRLEKTVAAFKIATWRRKENFREEVEEFIEKFNRAQINKSEDYFNDIFKSKKK
jgi:hypothetical protein